jgi:hypothetical protein
MIILVERRQSPRFACGGKAKILSLPLDGVRLDARLLDLSLGGCCVESQQPFSLFEKAEIVLHTNTASFRALAQIKASRGNSIGMQFVRLTETGNELLRQVLADAAKFHIAVSILRGARNRQSVELISEVSPEIKQVSLRDEFPVFRAMLREEQEYAESSQQRREIDAEARIVTIDDLWRVAIDVFA